MLNNINSELLHDEYRRELIDYYKWMTSLASLTLTLSVMIIGILKNGVRFKWFMLIAWLLLLSCILFNMLIVKRLVICPIVIAKPEEQLNILDWIFLNTQNNLKWYGNIQNLCFITGTFLLGLALILNVFLKSST